MSSLFYDASGWQKLTSHTGSSNTSTHILQRYSINGQIQIDQIYAFKTVSLTPPVTNKFISHQSIKYKQEGGIRTQIKALELLKPYRAIVELFQIVVENEGDEATSQFFRGFLRHKDHKGRHIGLIMEYCSMGSLSNKLSNSGSGLKYQEIIKIALQICQCLFHLKQVGIIHRDLRPDNVTLTSSGAKLVDFDTAFIRGYSSVQSLSMTFNKQILAPELSQLLNLDWQIKQSFSSDQLYLLMEKSDLFSFGILLQSILKSTQSNFENQLKDLIIGMKMPKPEERLNLDHVKKQLKKIANNICLEVEQRKIQPSNQLNFHLPSISFHPSTNSKSHSNSFSLSDWSFEESPPKLLRKSPQLPSKPLVLSPTTPRFRKPCPKFTLNT